MKKNQLSALALFVAVVALGFTILQPFYGARPLEKATDVPGQDLAVLRERITGMEQRLEALDRELAFRTNQQPSRLPLGASGDVPADADGRLAALEEGLFRLESRAWTLEDLIERGYRVVRLGYDEETLREWTELALDEEAADEKRLEALGRLCGQFLDEGVDARLAVLHSMLALAATTEDPATRAGIWRGLDGISDPILIDPLLASMRANASPEVRAAARPGAGPRFGPIPTSWPRSSTRSRTTSTNTSRMRPSRPLTARCDVP